MKSKTSSKKLTSNKFASQFLTHKYNKTYSVFSHSRKPSPQKNSEVEGSSQEKGNMFANKIASNTIFFNRFLPSSFAKNNQTLDIELDKSQNYPLMQDGSDKTPQTKQGFVMDYKDNLLRTIYNPTKQLARRRQKQKTKSIQQFQTLSVQS